MKNVALITGASSGIGVELARIHASKGGDLVLVARREEALNLLRIELQDKYNVKVVVIPVDLLQRNSAKLLFDKVNDLGIEVTYLFNNAGVGGYGKFHERNLKSEEEMIQLNIMSVTQLTHLFLPSMIARKNGKILNTASVAGFMPGPLQTVYYATKAFVVSFSQGISQELKGSGVTVSALCPGPVKTEFEATAGMSGSGLFEKAASAKSTAEKGYNGLEKGKLIIITDVLMRFGVNWVIPLIPRSIVLRMVEKLQTVK